MGRKASINRPARTSAALVASILAAAMGVSLYSLADVYAQDPGWFSPLAWALMSASAALLGCMWLCERGRSVARQQELLAERTAVAEHFRDIGLHANDAFLLIDAEFRILEANARAREMYGYTAAEFAAITARDLRGPDAGQRFERDYESWTADGVVYETVHRRKDGSEFPVEISGRLITVDGQDFHHATVRDITKRKATERALQESELRWRFALEAGGDGICDMDVATGGLTYSAHTFRMLGYESDRLPERLESAWEFVHPTDRNSLRNTLTSLLSGASVSEWQEARVRHADGTFRWLLFRAAVVSRAPDGSPARVIAVLTDITDRKRDEEEVRRLGSLYRMLSHASEAIVHATGSQTLFQALCEITARDGGFPFTVVMGRGDGAGELHPVAHAGNGISMYDGVRVSTSFEDSSGWGPSGSAVRDGLPCIVNDLAHDPAARHWSERAFERGLRAAAAFPVLRGGEPVASLTMFSDQVGFFDARVFSLLSKLTDDASFALDKFAADDRHRDVQQRLEQALHRQRLFLDTIPDRAWFKDADGRLLQVNRAYAKALGLPPEQVVGKRDEDMWPADIVAAFRENEELARNSCGPLRREISVRMPTGEDLEADVSITSLMDAEGRFGGTVGLVRDITERKRFEVERRTHAARLEQALVETIRAISMTVEKRDPYTSGHQHRVAELAVDIGREMGLEKARVDGLRLGAMIHDIGKIAVPAEILNRPGRLSPIEMELIKAHAEIGYDIVKDVEFPWPVAAMVRQHHERLDGSGYPQGLKGEEIVLEARIIAVADVVEAISAHRPYRPAMGVEKALDEIRRGRGVLYDARAVDACLSLFDSGVYSFDQTIHRKVG